MTDQTLKLPDPLDTGEVSVNRKLELIYQALTGLADQFTQLAAGQANLTEQVAQLAAGQAALAAGQANLTEQVAQLAAGQTALAAGQAEIVQRLDKLEKAQTELARLFRYQELGNVQREAAVLQRLAAAEERLDDLTKPRH